MNKQNIRLFLLFALFFLGMYLYNTWQEEHAVKDSPIITQASNASEKTTKDTSDLPTLLEINKKSSTQLPTIMNKSIDKDLIKINTDTMNLKIDPLGGDIVYLDLPKYPESLKDPDQGFVLLDESSKLFYIIQTGLLNELGPDSRKNGRATYSVDRYTEVMDDDESILNVDLSYTTSNDVKIIKRYIFTRGSYVIRVHYLINNQSSSNYAFSSFGRIKRRAPVKESSGMFGSTKTYTGAAINTPEIKYKKLSFSDMEKKPFKEDVMGGWAAMVEHYFASALVPSIEERNHYETENFGNDVYGIRFVSASTIVPSGTDKIIEVKLYAGPEIASQLKSLAPGLELTIDYGVLWFLCQPIFWLLKTMFDLFRNWGVAIIFTTIIIKAMFYKLSASSYKSMGNMRRLQPKIESLKKHCGDDKQKFSQSMMELYKKEKINPLGGCLPIIVQIPVFIALYYVLLECVELRQAPFFWWIKDLSAKDPYYVLPLIMGASMFVQQRLNPAPPDPIQAKVMMFMPIFFTFLFLQFPAGLVLYWVVNNLLSILQQWMITRRMERSSK